MIIHAGQHKTGTSSFQEFMGAHYKDSCTRNSFKYLGFPELNHSKGMVALFSPNPLNHYLFKQSIPDLKRMQELKFRYSRLLDKAMEQNTNLIISGEEIGTLPDVSKVHLVEFFRQRGYEIEVLLVVRNPSDFASSLIQQWVKGGRYGEESFSINALYSRYYSVFGFSGDVTCSILSYEDLISAHGSTVSGLASQIGLDPIMIEKAASLEWVNSGLSESATRLVYRLNRFLSTSSHRGLSARQRQRLFDTLRKQFPTETDPLNSTALTSSITEQARSEIYELKELFGIDYSSTKLSPADQRATHEYLEKCNLVSIPKTERLIPTGDENLDSVIQLLIESLS